MALRWGSYRTKKELWPRRSRRASKVWTSMFRTEVKIYHSTSQQFPLRAYCNSRSTWNNQICRCWCHLSWVIQLCTEQGKDFWYTYRYVQNYKCKWNGFRMCLSLWMARRLNKNTFTRPEYSYRVRNHFEIRRLLPLSRASVSYTHLTLPTKA